ncbi:MAG: hypothetical protein ACRCT1_16295 [Microcoleaceae cyanobacterium]
MSIPLRQGTIAIDCCGFIKMKELSEGENRDFGVVFLAEFSHAIGQKIQPLMCSRLG